MDYELAGSPTWRRKALLPMAFSDTSTDGAYLSEQMKSAGVDLATPAAVETAFGVLSDLIERLDGLVN